MIKRIIGTLSSSKTKKCIVILALLSLVIYLFLILLTPVNNIWNKVVAILYIVCVGFGLMLVGSDKLEMKSRFHNSSSVSFVKWCIVIPIILGIIISCLFTHFYQTDIEEVSAWSIVSIAMVSSVIWFGYKLYIQNVPVNILDVYSNIMLSMLTVVTTAFDLHDKKVAFSLLLLTYSVQQVLIKIKVLPDHKTG